MSHFFRRRLDRFDPATSAPATDSAGGTSPVRREHPPRTVHPRVRRSRIRFVAMFVVGLAVSVITGLTASWMVAPAAGWFVAACLYDVLVWRSIAGMDADQTRDHARAEDPSRAARELLLLIVNVASLLAVVVLVVATSRADKGTAFAYGVLALATVAASWVLLHTVFTLRYAARYYGSEPAGGVFFNTDEPPCYADFAYIAFTIGMSFAVSDPAVISTDYRKLVLQHTFFAYVYGTTIVATTVSLVVGLF